MKKLIALGLFLVLSIPSFAQETQTETIPISAEIPLVEGLSVGISRVDISVNPQTGQVTENWVPGQSEINFGTLYFDETWGIWRANCYYVVDVGVDTNADNWTLQYEASDLTDGKGHFLNNNVNVRFRKMIKQNGNDVEAANLGDYSYGMKSNSFTKFQLGDGWLRIYYGIATGSGDAPGVEVITMDKPAGTYTGTITLTLTIAPEEE